MIDAYTFFDDAYDKIHEWSGPEAKLQNTIINNYTNEIPLLMREVTFLKVTTCKLSRIRISLL